MTTATSNKRPSKESSGASPDQKTGRRSRDVAPRADNGKAKGPTDRSATGAPSDHERRKESSKLSQQALAAQKKAQELRQAANGAADPDERQHLMEEAINAQIEAESFGKTARYLQSGTFQGLAVGTGIGTVPGLTLGTLTGTLVGGTVSVITGSLGGAMGAAAGALHGPFWNMGELAGKGIRKVTGDLPGWKATDEQKATLEKMIGQINDQDPPAEDDLQAMAGWERETSTNEDSQTWAGYGASYLPSMPTGKGSSHESSSKPPDTARQPIGHAGDATKPVAKRNKSASPSGSNKKPDKNPKERPNRVTSNTQQASPAETSQISTKLNDPGQQSSSSQSHKKPRKLERRPPAEKSKQSPSTPARKTPRKLEVRK